MAGIAQCLVGLGQFDEGARKYEEVAEKYPDLPLSGKYLMMAFKTYLNNNELESARQVYDNFVQEYKRTEYYDEVQSLATQYHI